ncbi:F-box/LRR-repeat protein 4 [Ceratitis capitata]|uniref:F-box/LRR-repeat protein 4 n=1 Tax=Ceratitis capitata TaxID=7213 RepID=UPI000329F826|nr:F-box/LRR-repeat protein 4 [Ceratitis capitata]
MSLNDAAKILSLDNDCLEKLCSFLPFIDQVRFGHVCQRFRYVIEGIFQRRFKECVLDDLIDIMIQMKLKELRNFFRLAGPQLESLSSRTPFIDRSRSLELIAPFCTQLKALNLSGCFLNDDSIRFLQSLKKLEVLTISANREITGAYINNLLTLTELDLYGCIKVETPHLIAVFKALPNLRLLDIRDCMRMLPELFSEMANHCQSLEVLKMSCPKFSYAAVASLPKLKELVLLDRHRWATTRACLFEELSVRKTKQLESLEIHTRNSLSGEHTSLIAYLKGLKTLVIEQNTAVNDHALSKFCELKKLEILVVKKCADITNKAVLNLLRNCPVLRHLNIQLCYGITTPFVIELISILKAEEGVRKKPLVVLVFGTKIDKEKLLQNATYIEAVEQLLIKVVFGIPHFELDNGNCYNYRRGKARPDEYEGD